MKANAPFSIRNDFTQASASHGLALPVIPEKIMTLDVRWEDESGNEKAAVLSPRMSNLATIIAEPV